MRHTRFDRSEAFNCQPAMIVPVTPDYDVIILGGAFSGASAAILLRREHPELRVLIVEKSEAFDAKVGEATTEMSAMFLTRRLAMWHHLEAEQLPKEGLRYWFSNDKVTGHANATEAGRSEEHTSELQSQSNLVCRLLLEKKKSTTSTPLSSVAACSSNT